MQKSAAKSVRKAGTRKNTKAKAKKKKKLLKIPGLSSSRVETIDWGDEDEDEDSKKEEMVEVKEVKDFAGEKLIVKKKVAANSREAKKFKKRSKLDDLISSLKGPKKLNTLDKCAIDWEKDKAQEGDREELQIASRNGELEKKRFLQETDYRQFERERDARNEQRKKQGIIL